MSATFDNSNNGSILKHQSYNMNNQMRGICIIINNKRFLRETGMGERFGTDRDLISLVNLFRKSLGFQVYVQPKELSDGVTRAQMLNILKEASQCDFTNYDCFACIILSHGNDGIIYGTDGCIRVESVFAPFTAENCPSLAGKPKFFLIQACRGTKEDSGAVVKVTANDCDVLFRAKREINGNAKDCIAETTVTAITASDYNSLRILTNTLTCENVKEGLTSTVCTQSAVLQNCTQDISGISGSAALSIAGTVALSTTSGEEIDSLDNLYCACSGDSLETQATANRHCVDGVTGTDGKLFSFAGRKSIVPTTTYQCVEEPDFLVAYSTTPGYYAWRNSANGSWFIEAFVNVMNQQLKKYAESSNAYKFPDMMSIMTMVNRSVACEYEAKEHGKKKQIPSVVSTLTKDFCLKPKLSDFK